MQQLFQTMKNKEEIEEQGQLPDFISDINTRVISSIFIGMKAILAFINTKQNGRLILKSFKK